MTPNKALRRLQILGKACVKMGIKPAFCWVGTIGREQLGIRTPTTWTTHPRAACHPVTMRLRGSSDVNVFSEVFIEEQYGCFNGTDRVNLVIDLGANVGYSSAYFLTAFPGCRVVAVEPDDGNVRMCKVNLAAYGDRAVVLQGAAWSEDTKLTTVRGEFGDGRDWATQVRDLGSRDGDVSGWTVASILHMAGGQTVDILKIDIERAELAVFSGDTSWLRHVRNICIELHGSDCEAVFSKALADFDFDSARSGELTVCRNLRPHFAGAGG